MQMLYKSNLYIKFFFILTILLETSCTKNFGLRVATMNNYAFNYIDKQDAPYEIKEGMRDGCLTSLWSRGNHFYRGLTTYRQNQQLINNPSYRFAWNRAYGMCFHMNNIDTFTVLGEKLFKNSMSGTFDLREAKDWGGLTVGGNQAYAPSIPFTDDSTERAMFGYDVPAKSGSFFGFFGTCQFC